MGLPPAAKVRALYQADSRIVNSLKPEIRVQTPEITRPKDRERAGSRVLTAGLWFLARPHPRPAGDRLPPRARCLSPARRCLSSRMRSSRCGGDLVQASEHAARAGGDQPADDDVFLQALERVDLPLTAASVSTRVVSWKEAAEMKERVCKAGLGDAEQDRLPGCRLAALLLQPLCWPPRSRCGRPARP